MNISLQSDNQPINSAYFWFMDFHIGQKIDEVRQQRGWQTTALAQKINRHRDTLSKIFAGKKSPEVDLLSELCTVLNHNFFDDLAKQHLTDKWDLPVIKEDATNYGNNYRDKYFILLEKYAELQEKLNSGSVAETVKAIATRNEAFQELIMDFLAKDQNMSIEEVHASLGIKLNEHLMAQKLKGTQTG